MHGQVGEAPRGNLQASGQNSRLRFGGIMLAVALVAAVVLVQADVSRAWRVALFVPFFLASFGAWQGLYRVCPGMASKGCREGAHGEDQRIMRSEELSSVKRSAKGVMLGSFATAVLATALVFFVR